MGCWLHVLRLVTGRFCRHGRVCVLLRMDLTPVCTPQAFVVFPLSIRCPRNAASSSLSGRPHLSRAESNRRSQHPNGLVEWARANSCGLPAVCGLGSVYFMLVPTAPLPCPLRLP